MHPDIDDVMMYAITQYPMYEWNAEQSIQRDEITMIVTARTLITEPSGATLFTRVSSYRRIDYGSLRALKTMDIPRHLMRTADALARELQHELAGEGFEEIPVPVFIKK